MRDPGNPQRPPALELHIDELILHGFAPGDRLAIGDAVQSELVRLITEQGFSGISESVISIDRLNGGSFNIRSGSAPHTIGTKLARTVHQQLGPGLNSEATRQPKGPVKSR